MSTPPKTARHPLFQGYLKRRRQLVCSGSEAWHYDPTNVCSTTPLLISSRADTTAAHIYQIADEQEEAIRWITYESIISDGISFTRLKELIEHTTGIYLRHPFSEARDVTVIATCVDALLEGHDNVIRPSTRSTNWSKPLHSHELRKIATNGGLQIVTAMVTNHPDLSDDRLCKGISHMPTVALRLSDLDCPPSQGPYLTQKILLGQEFRIHVLDELIFACVVAKGQSIVDYRSESSLMLKKTEIPNFLHADLIALTHSEGLRFSGIDLIQESEYCYTVLEVNPMPGFHCYDLCPDYPITNAILTVLKG